MKSKNAIRDMIRKLLRLGYIVQAKKLLDELQSEQVYFEDEDGVRRIKKNDFAKQKVVSLEEYRRSRDK